MIISFCMYAWVQVAIFGHDVSQRGKGVRFCLFCQAEIVGKVNHAGGVSFVKSNAAFVCKVLHLQYQW